MRGMGLRGGRSGSAIYFGCGIGASGSLGRVGNGRGLGHVHVQPKTTQEKGPRKGEGR